MAIRSLLLVVTLVTCWGSTLVAQEVGGPPAWFPLPPAHEKYLDDVLKYWEHTAAQVERYRCKFRRWEYDPTRFSRPTDNVASVISEGEIQFAAPDKGLFQVTKLWRVAVQEVMAPDQRTKIVVPAVKDGKPQYEVQTDIAGEHWVCDGRSIFQFDSINKQLIKRELPPELQGKRIVDGPLPFLFGAKAQEIKDRYWIRVVSPPPEAGHFHLEAIPKRREEAADFRALVVVIDEKEFLPTSLQLLERGGGRTNYVFFERESNWNLLPEKLNPFHQQFFAPKLPAGWKQVNQPYQAGPEPTLPAQPVGPAAAAPMTPNFAPARQAQAAPRTNPPSPGQTPIGPQRR